MFVYVQRMRYICSIKLKQQILTTMYYRFQSNTELQTSVHPYPTVDLLPIYANSEAVNTMINQIKSGEVSWDDVCSYDDVDNYFFKPNYVCCNWIDDEDLAETMVFSGSSCSADDEYVVLFESEEEYRIFDGLVAKCESFVKIYKKVEGNTYTSIK